MPPEKNNSDKDGKMIVIEFYGENPSLGYIRDIIFRVEKLIPFKEINYLGDTISFRITSLDILVAILIELQNSDLIRKEEEVSFLFDQSKDGDKFIIELGQVY